MRFDYLAVACGGGRNSAMLLGMYERSIVPDHITFADTGGEKPEPYEAIDRLSRWCQEHLGLPITTVHKHSMYSSLEDNCLRREMLPSAAYGFRSCSDKWKIQPQDRYFNNLEATVALWKQGKKVTKALGYDAGEKRRGSNMQESAKYRFWFPLVEWGWFLEDCQEAFVRHGLPVPPKSACFYCPSSKKSEVLELARNHPDLFQRAVDMERKAQATSKVVKGLGRHWSWEELVKASEVEAAALIEAPQMSCTCLDAEE